MIEMKTKMAVVLTIDVPTEWYFFPGFIYMSPFVHSSLTYSQYVAPLMVYFDTRGNNSEILYKKI